LRELQALAKLLGCRFSGTKEELVIRVLAQRKLRFKLARFTDNPDELASSYRRASFRDMCRKLGTKGTGVTRHLPKLISYLKKPVENVRSQKCLQPREQRRELIAEHHEVSRI